MYRFTYFKIEKSPNFRNKEHNLGYFFLTDVSAAIVIDTISQSSHIVFAKKADFIVKSKNDFSILHSLG